MPKPLTASEHTPIALTETLSQLCHTQLIETLVQDAEYSIDALGNGVGALELNNEIWDTQPVEGGSSYTRSMGLLLTNGIDTVRFKAHSMEIDPTKVNPDDLILDDRKPWGRSYRTQVIDLAGVIHDLRSKQLGAGYMKIIKPQFPLPWHYGFEVARLQSTEAVDTPEAHRRLLKLSRALLRQVTLL